MTRDTVMADTPAIRATSSIVTLPRLRRLGLLIQCLPQKLDKRRGLCMQIGNAVDRGPTLNLLM
jgi:hypothetical protein